MIQALLLGQLQWNIPLLFLFLGVIVLYFFLFKINDVRAIYRVQPILFLLGIGVLYLVMGSPLLSISYLLFSFHMILMSILYFIIPPILLLGIPHSIYHKVKAPLHVISPKLSLIFFATLLFFYHTPILLTYLLDNIPILHGYKVLLFIFSLKTWLPIVSPDPVERFLGEELKRFVFLSGLFITPACLLFIVSAFLEGLSNPFLVQLTAHLCLPETSLQLSLLPINAKYDQIMSGIFMFGIHKLSLVSATRIQKKWLCNKQPPKKSALNDLS